MVITKPYNPSQRLSNLLDIMASRATFVKLWEGLFPMSYIRRGSLITPEGVVEVLNMLVQGSYVVMTVYGGGHGLRCTVILQSSRILGESTSIIHLNHPVHGKAVLAWWRQEGPTCTTEDLRGRGFMVEGFLSLKEVKDGAVGFLEGWWLGASA